MMRGYGRYIALCLVIIFCVLQIDPSEGIQVKQTVMAPQGIIADRNINKLSFDGAEYDQLRAMKQLNIISALQKYEGNYPVTVAVLDTGIDYLHEDLYENIWKNEKEIPGNGIDDDKNGYIDDVYGWDFYNNDNTVCYRDEKEPAKNRKNDDHGTHCAGLIAGMAGNHLGIAGIAGQGNVKIMIVKVFDESKEDVTGSKLADAIRYATAMGADIINASWSGKLNSEKEAEQLKEAIVESGKLFITSAGNYGESNDENTNYPACFADLDNVVVVGSVEENGTISQFSNYGDSVHIAANGNHIYSTMAGSLYGYCSGTSMSTAIVTGMAALVYGEKTHVYPKAVKELLLYSSKLMYPSADGKNIKEGIIDAEQVVKNIQILLNDEKTPVVYETVSNYNGDVAFSVLEQGGSGVCSMNYASGSKKSSYFFHGMKGTRLKNPWFHVKKSGKYTIFLRDYAGNESVKVINVIVDRKTPSISAVINPKYITFQITDKDTGVAKVRYAYGKKELSYFKSGKGKKVTLKKNKFKIKYDKKKKYITVYAEDKAKNKRVTPFYLKGE